MDGYSLGSNTPLNTNLTSGGGSSTTFVGGSSTASITTSAVNLPVRAPNLSGKRVYVQMWRDRVGSYAAREWSYSTIASGSSVTFNDLDGTGNTLRGVDYYIVASLEPIDGGTAAQRST